MGENYVMLPFLLYLVLGMIFLSGCGEKVLYPRISPTIWSNYFQLQDIKTGNDQTGGNLQNGSARGRGRGGKSG